MRTFVNLTIILVILSVCSSASAQTISRFRLPAGRRLSVMGETYQGFVLSEYTELLHMDEDLRFLTEAHSADLARVHELETAYSSLNDALGTCAEQVTLLGTERTRLTALWEEEHRLRVEAESRPDWSWIPWSLAGGLAISTLVLGIIVGVQ